ncbi:GDSL-type esterase/lipase family protein [Streptomyces sp. NPDC090303]|uniref:GDSL-type esterase/lipase family protein n=1 Tax=Streptomyces sp. NPDC090303 TaxID=3365960 RepID=UPI0038131D35
MARNLFGGTADCVAEDIAGARVAGAVGTVWDGPSAGANQLTDLTDENGAPLSQLTADAHGYVGPFYGPDGYERLWLDFGAGRVALVSVTVGERLESHRNAADPHGDRAYADSRFVSQSAFDAAQPKPGIYVPPNWGTFWKGVRGTPGKLARIAAVGSSSTQGLYSSDLAATSWAQRVATGLQAQYGDGGSGYFASTRSITFLGANTTATGWAGIPGTLATTTGSWSNGNPYGPGGGYIFTSTNGNTITFTVRGSTVRIYTVGGSNRAGWKYSIDGGADVAVADPGGTTTIAVTTVQGLPATTHTVKLTHNGTTGSYFAVSGVTGENTSGVVLNNFGLSGATSATFADTTPAYGTTTWNGGPDYPADLVIYALGSNDVLAGVGVDVWAKNLRAYLQSVKDGTGKGGTPATGTTDVLILMQHIGKYDASNFLWQDYVSRGRMIAEAYGAAFVDFWTLGRNSWNYWNSLGHWGNASTVGGVSGTDTIHMSNAGHQFTADTLLSILKS